MTIERARVGVVSEDPRGSPLVLADAITQQGFPFRPLRVLELETVPELPPVVVLAGTPGVSRAAARRLQAHLEAGGGLVALNTVAGVEDLLGVEARDPEWWFPFPVGGHQALSLGEGYARDAGTFFEEFPPDWFPLHAFGCLPLVVDSARVLAWYDPVTGTRGAGTGAGTGIGTGNAETPGEWPAVTVRQVGQGVALCLGVDVARTTRHVQEGRYVDADGIPPADGMAPVDDGILKCEDGLVLDWDRDRRPISVEHHVPAFTIPVADAWRRVLAACLEHVADACGVTLERVDFWPDGAEFVALLSHDTDGNDPRLARVLLENVNALGIHTTWCLIPPGYPPGLCVEIAGAGHELGFHFDAQSFSHLDVFTFADLEAQLEETIAQTGLPGFYSNKNHYTRWEGRVQFFEWCARLGMKVDQSKGPSKTGTALFPFGTCHPWQALDASGHPIDCLEVGFQSQDFGLMGPADVGPDLLEAVQRARGVAHVIFHPAHAEKPRVAEAMRAFVARARAMGARFLTSREIGEWTCQRTAYVRGDIDHLPGARHLRRDPARHAWEVVQPDHARNQRILTEQARQKKTSEK